jgi:hypothetical protein
MGLSQFLDTSNFPPRRWALVENTETAGKTGCPTYFVYFSIQSLCEKVQLPLPSQSLVGNPCIHRFLWSRLAKPLTRRIVVTGPGHR